MAKSCAKFVVSKMDLPRARKMFVINDDCARRGSYPPQSRWQRSLSVGVRNQFEYIKQPPISKGGRGSWRYRPLGPPCSGYGRRI